ncbi:MAG: DUF4118 domain-containing protein [Sphingobium sp.]
MQRANYHLVERLPLALPAWQTYFLTTLFGLGALTVRLMADHLMPPGYPFVTFFPAVILASFLFGVRPGVYAALLCGILSWYWFIPPRMAFAFDRGTMIALAFYTAVVAVDILLVHFMQRANYHLSAERERNRLLADNRELLFHELQHRVSNNLQVVAAMLALQRRHVADESAARALDNAAARTALIGRISRALYDPLGAGQGMEAFLCTLTTDIMAASGRSDIAVSCQAPAGLSLETDVAVPLALVVAEAVNNAIEHGFAARGGAIALTLRQEAGATILTVADDGAGLAPDFAPVDGSLGLRIAQSLAAQLGGRFMLEPGADGGAVARLELPCATH